LVAKRKIWKSCAQSSKKNFQGLIRSGIQIKDDINKAGAIAFA
jgi:hypothetical protein